MIKNSHLQLCDDVATAIAHIACYKGELPQGSPCSPIISNLLGRILDIRLVRLAKKYQCTYSRYADDITFSTNKKIFPPEIAYPHAHTEHTWVVGGALQNTIIRTGYNINHQKTRMQYNGSRQVVTGLVVNKKVNVTRTYYRLAKAMSHSLFMNGSFTLPGNNVQDDNISRLRGVFSHIYNVKLYDSTITRVKENGNKRSEFIKIYFNLLAYTYFHALDRPLIICEGKTDNIYLRCALRRLYPDSMDAFRLFNYTKVNRNVLMLPGGSRPLSHLIHNYKTYIKPFKCSGRKYPVIILIDNDNGARGNGNPFAAIKTVRQTPNSVDGDEPFYFVRDNLYVLPTPKKNGEHTKIEDCFDKKTLDILIGGKKFNPENAKPIDDKEYGKIVFAEQVVKRMQASIDFSGFIPIFDLIFTIISDYQNRSQPSPPLGTSVPAVSSPSPLS